ncbi:membrane anchored protein in chemotaxis locus [Shewanella baltica]|uniref:membrane anchored protein in chemotaxis locus n=1 Tax=Shewanella TaxID=22 RepID=UPI001CF1D1EA|nr:MULTISPECIES: membrane anchored protein in chemotaxis locus [Shewanella]MCB2381963.1 membrane anchored protein in chemotaxis locus [Shewanella sp. SR1]MCS6229711.1 membrane anchored protein in chemotaxis locus [Shewanella baltica]
MSTNSVLIILLMAIAILCLGALSLDYRHKNSLLREDIKRLESTQVLLMVPDEQAEAIATWLASHPDQTKAMLQFAAPGEQKAVAIGPEPTQIGIPPLLGKQSAAMDTAKDNANQQPLVPPTLLQTPEAEVKAATSPMEPKNAQMLPVVISENADGVKVISLPNGGIRVTTRKEQ